MLASVALALSHDTGWNVCQSDCRAGLVDVLTACTRCSIDVLAYIFFEYLNFDCITHFWRNIDSGKAGLTLAFRIVWTDSDQTVNAFFALKVSIGGRAANNYRRLRDASTFVIGSVD